MFHGEMGEDFRLSRDVEAFSKKSWCGNISRAESNRSNGVNRWLSGFLKINECWNYSRWHVILRIVRMVLLRCLQGCTDLFLRRSRMIFGQNLGT